MCKYAIRRSLLVCVLLLGACTSTSTDQAQPSASAATGPTTIATTGPLAQPTAESVAEPSLPESTGPLDPDALVQAATIVAAIERASVEEQLVVNMNSQVFASSGIQRELTVDREANYFVRAETRWAQRVPLTVQYTVDSTQGIFSTPPLDYGHTLDAADLGWFQQQGEVVIDTDTGETSQLPTETGPWAFKDQGQFDEIFAMMTRIVEEAPEIGLDQGTFAFELDNATAFRAMQDLLDDSRADPLSIAGRAAVSGTVDSEGRLTSFRLAMADAVVEDGAGLAAILLLASDAFVDVSVGFGPHSDTEALVAAAR